MRAAFFELSVCEMTQREEHEAIISERLLAADVALLEDHNVSDEFMTLLAAEHAARCETFAKAIEPTLGRAFLLVAAGALLSAAKQIDGASVPTDEIIHVR
jgi:hypothetical protein